jgi:TRAP transporter TAXI family solute receptor
MADCNTRPHERLSTHDIPVLRLVRDTTFGDVLVQIYQRQLPGVRIESIDAIGSVETVDAIRTGKADLGFTFADVAYFTYLGRAQQSGVMLPPAQLRGVAALGIAPIQVLARSGLSVHSLSDLTAHRVGVGTVLSRQTLLAHALFHAYGLDSEVIQPDRRSDLLAGVDATFAFGYYPLATVQDAMEQGAQLIPMDGPIAKKLQREYPFMRSVTIPSGTYPQQSHDLVTLGLDRLLVCSATLDVHLAHEITRVFIESLPELASHLHTSIRLTNIGQASATPIPLHDGSAQYYRERELVR